MMSSKSAVSVCGLTKSFKRLDSPKDQMRNFLGMTVPATAILKGVDFTIKHGERVGILGVNGAGKSTLLNIIAGMMKPTAGSVVVDGEIGAILELGAGFHPELTGRQNVEMLLALRGISPSSIARFVGDVRDFSELGEALDAKVRTYSSGMLVRLAFATACVVTPDIFIIDEALAVGDARFQQKCYNFLMESMSSRTLILISHDMSAISAICDRILILNDGRIAFDGHPTEGIIAYNRIVQKPSAPSGRNTSLIHSRKFGPGGIDILSTEFLVDDAAVSMVRAGDKARITMEIDNHLGQISAIAGFHVQDIRGQKVFGQSSASLEILKLSSGKSVVSLDFKWPKLASGPYTVTVGIGTGLSEHSQQVQCFINDAFELESVLPEVSFGMFNIELDKVSHSGLHSSNC